MPEPAARAGTGGVWKEEGPPELSQPSRRDESWAVAFACTPTPFLPRDICSGGGGRAPLLSKALGAPGAPPGCGAGEGQALPGLLGPKGSRRALWRVIKSVPSVADGKQDCFGRSRR